MSLLRGADRTAHKPEAKDQHRPGRRLGNGRNRGCTQAKLAQVLKAICGRYRHPCYRLVVNRLEREPVGPAAELRSQRVRGKIENHSAVVRNRDRRVFVISEAEQPELNRAKHCAAAGIENKLRQVEGSVARSGEVALKTCLPAREGRKDIVARVGPSEVDYPAIEGAIDGRAALIASGKNIAVIEGRWRDGDDVGLSGPSNEQRGGGEKYLDGAHDNGLGDGIGGTKV